MQGQQPQQQSPPHAGFAQLNIADSKTSLPESPEQRVIRELQAQLAERDQHIRQIENPYQFDIPAHGVQDYKTCIKHVDRIRKEITSLINMGDRLGGMVFDPAFDIERKHTSRGASQVDAKTRKSVHDIKQSLRAFIQTTLPTLQNDLASVGMTRFRREAINHKVNIDTKRRNAETKVRQDYQRDLVIARRRTFIPSGPFSTVSSSSGVGAPSSYLPTSSAYRYDMPVLGPLGGEEPADSEDLGGTERDNEDAVADQQLEQPAERADFDFVDECDNGLVASNK